MISRMASCLLLLLCASTVLAQPVRPTDALDDPPLVRELLVPFEHLDVVLKDAGRRVFLTRDEYEQLVQQASVAGERPAPVAVSLLSASYQAELLGTRVRVQGTLLIDVTAPGVQAISLPLVGAGLLSALLDGQPAALGIPERGQSRLFLEGKGRHTLQLELSIPVEVTAAQQAMTFQLPTSAAGSFELTVPGQADVKSGISVLERRVSQGETTFGCLLPSAATTLVLSLSNEQSQGNEIVVARTVLVDELTETYERLHVTAAMQVAHGAVEEFRYRVPDGFDVTRVQTPLLSRWQVVSAAEGNVLQVELSEATTVTEVLNITLQRNQPQLTEWQLPVVQPLDVVGTVSVVGLLLDEHLEVTSLDQAQVVPLDLEAFTATLQSSIFDAEPGAPAIRPIVAFFAPAGEFSLVASFVRPPAKLVVQTNQTLRLTDEGHVLNAEFTLTPLAERTFECNLVMDPEWELTRVEQAEQPLDVQTHSEPNGRLRTRITLAQGIDPGKTVTLSLEAKRTPSDWLADWQSRTVVFPEFTLREATEVQGALAVRAEDDLVAEVNEVVGLLPLDAREMARYGVSDDAVNLAYFFESLPARAELEVRRVLPRLTAETYSFVTIEPNRLQVHYELLFDVADARTRQLTFVLPRETPGEIQVEGRDGVTLKEYQPRLEEDGRYWDVMLEAPRRGAVRLVASFEQGVQTPISSATADTRSGTALTLPLVRAANVLYQTGAVAVEGSSELEVSLDTDMRRIDVGELIDASYQPGDRLLGAYGFVGDPPTVAAQVMRPPQYGLPAAIVERGELVSAFSASGLCQTAARYQLRTKASFLEVELPVGSTLWSAYLDDKPAKPQRSEQGLLMSIPQRDGHELRDLRLVYETPSSAVGFWGNLEMSAPRLYLRESPGAAPTEVPLADVQWHVALPAGFRLVESWGTVFPDWEHARTSELLANHATPFEKLTTAMAQVQVLPALASSVSADSMRSWGQRGRSASQVRNALSGPRLGTNSEKSRNPNRFDAWLSQASPKPSSQESPDRFSQSALEQSSTESPEPLSGALAGVPGGDGGGVSGKLWALEGLRSLQIDLATPQGRLLFRSLGERPMVSITVVDDRQLNLLGWACALFVLGVGLALIPRPFNVRLRYVLCVLVLAAVAPLVVGGRQEMGRLVDPVMFAALCLLPLYAGWWLLSKVARMLSGRFLVPAAAVVLCLAGVLTPHPEVAAEETETQVGPIRVKLLGPEAPVTIPRDVVIVPYDPEQGTGSTDGKVIVPYEKYVELWDLAYPQQKLEATAPSANVAWAGAEWEATLADQDSLLVRGSIVVDALVEELVGVPVEVVGGVFETALMDGEPARIVSAHSEPQQQKSGDSLSRQGMILVQGKGRHRLEVTLRFRLERRGGWRVIAGQLPHIPAARLRLQIPQPNTELRMQGDGGRIEYDSKQPEEVLETSVTAGKLNFQWREKVAQAAVDQSLTVESEAVFDVQEDRLRLNWKVHLQFPRALRDEFEFEVNRDYLVEQVRGENVGSWRREGARLLVTLLKPARDQHLLTLELSQRDAVAEAGAKQVVVPVLRVPDAVLHEGRLALRRSPLMRIRAMQTQGLVRTDLQSVAIARQTKSESPLGIQPFQAYRFARTPFQLRLGVERVTPQVSAATQMLVRLSEHRQSMEARILLDPKSRPLYRAELTFPRGFSPREVVAPGMSHSSVTEQADGTNRLQMFFGKGQAQPFAIVLNGEWQASAGEDSTDLPLPTITVGNVAKQETTLVVQTSPDLTVRASDLSGCETVLLEQAYAWLEPHERPLARIALRAPSSGFSGRLLVTPRTPRVVYRTLSNLRVTPRAFEETILLDFTIADAGVREVAFLLPADLREARMSAPLIRRKVIEDVSGEQIRVRLELKDAVMGQFRVLVENDRLVTGDERDVPIPIVETGVADEQFVALESAGRDEVVVARTNEVVPLGRQQSQWRALASMLGDRVTQAYLVANQATSPQLVVQTKDRAVLETVGARIAFAETLLVVDEQGAYRGTQTYQVDNRTEQFLEIILPEGALLWTARVSQTPVKPIAGQGVVRVPLTKTAEGDQDYTVELKYGGRLDDLGTMARVRFPLMKTANINVEESQVRLLLPEALRWFNFDGTMRRVDAKEDLVAGYVQYKKEQLMAAASGLASKNPFAKARSLNNLKKFVDELESLDNTSQRMGGNVRLKTELESSRRAVQMARRQIQEEAEVASGEEQPAFSNSYRLNEFFEQQSNSRSARYFSGGVSNFDVAASEDEAEEDAQAVELQRAWIASNNLNNSVLSAETLGKRIRGVEPKRTTRSKAGLETYGYGGEDSRQPGAGKQEGGAFGGYGGGGYGGGYQSRDGAVRDGLVDAAEALGEERESQQSYGAPSARLNTQQRVEQFQAQLQQQGANPAPLATEENALFAQHEAAQMGNAAGEVIDTEGIFSGGEAMLTGLASLDVKLPSRGVEYMFTTPRGDVQITARGVDSRIVHRGVRGGSLIVLLMVVLGLQQLVDRLGFDRIFNRGVSLTLLVGSVVLSIWLGSTWPLLLGGCAAVQWIRLRLGKTAASVKAPAVV